MTSRSEISASPSDPCVAARSTFCDCVGLGASEHENVCDVYRSILWQVVSLALFLSLSLLFLVVVSVCMSSCDVRRLLGHTICRNLCVCVCVQSIYAEPAAVHLLDGFPLFTVYCLRFIGSPTFFLWHFDVDVAGHRTLLHFFLLFLVAL